MKRWVIGLSLPLLIVAFQNCEEVDGIYFRDGSSSVVAYDDGTIEDVDWAGVEFAIEAGNPESRYHIDLETGHVYPVDEKSGIERDAKEDLYCLTNTQLQELRGIVDGSKVCVPANKIKPDQLCTMIYGYPYAWLVSDEDDNSVLPLGEIYNGCHQPTDLCGSTAGLLQGFLASLKNKVKSQPCP